MGFEKSWGGEIRGEKSVGVLKKVGVEKSVGRNPWEPWEKSWGGEIRGRKKLGWRNPWEKSVGEKSWGGEIRGKKSVGTNITANQLFIVNQHRRTFSRKA